MKTPEEILSEHCNGKYNKWISVNEKLPELYLFGMSKDVLTIAGSKMRVNSYDYELKRWNGSPHITVKYWMELPSPPIKSQQEPK